MSRFAAILSALFLAAPVVGLGNEVLVLKTGGKIEGKWLNPSESPRETYQFQTPHGGRLSIEQHLVERVIQRTLEEQRYKLYLPKMPNTVDGHWKMAEWCRTHSLDEHRQTHLEAIIQREPNHERARHGLGYGKMEDRWVKTADYMREQGYVRHRGGWRLPIEVERDQYNQNAEEAEKRWRREIKNLRSLIGKRRGIGAIDRIRAIRDVTAAPALAELLDTEMSRPLKEAYVRALAEMDSPIASSALVKHCIDEPDARIRDLCREALKRREGRASVRPFIKALTSNNNVEVNRAAAALALLGDENSVLPLINALVTTHKYKTAGSGGQMTTSFGNGSGGLSTGGGKPKIIIRQQQNPAALQALVVLTGGANYAYNQPAWRNWYTRSTTPPGLSLRRDD